MPKRKRSRMPSDPNKLAASILNKVTKSEPVSVSKNPAAVALGRLGGLKGGHARARALTQEQRSASAAKAAAVRWSRKKK